MQRDSGLNLLLRVLWFYFVGLPLGLLWLAIAWLCCLTVIGLPVGLWMFHAAPKLMTLKEEGSWQEFQAGGRTAYFFKQADQTNVLVRAVYFLLVGWWLSLLWLKLAVLAAATFIGIPLAFWMFNRVPFVLTLHED